MFFLNKIDELKLGTGSDEKFVRLFKDSDEKTLILSISCADGSSGAIQIDSKEVNENYTITGVLKANGIGAEHLKLNCPSITSLIE